METKPKYKFKFICDTSEWIDGVFYRLIDGVRFQVITDFYSSGPDGYRSKSSVSRLIFNSGVTHFLLPRDPKTGCYDGSLDTQVDLNKRVN